MTGALPALDDYLARLAALGAPVIRRLRPGASAGEIARLAALDGVTLTDEARFYWAQVNGVDDAEPWGHSYLFGHIYLPQSVAEAIDHYEQWAEMRADDRLEPGLREEGFPKGMIRFAGEDGNGLHVNCIAGSPTYGAVYERVANVAPLIRQANSMQQYFLTLIAALEAGAIRLREEPGEHRAVGELETDYDRFHEIQRSLSPGLPVWDQHWQPDWIP